MKNKIRKVTFTVMVVFHIGFATSLFIFTWQRLFLALAVWYVAMSPGVGVGFHRLLTHRGFKTPKWVEYTLTLCGYLALQGGAIWWVLWHRLHHKYTEQKGLDPHTPLDGKWWSHIDWLVHQRPDLKNPENMAKYCPDLCRDKLHVWLNKVVWLPATVFGVSVFFLAGLPAMMWAVFVPVTFGWHCTWLVNSATHMWGSRPHQTPDDSRNNWWVALLTFGEGWHNNHHANLTSARHGEKWYQIDLNWYLICLMRLFGLTKKVQV